MELLAKEISGLVKSSILDVWLGSEYPSEIAESRLWKTRYKNCKCVRWNWGSMQLPLNAQRSKFLLWICKKCDGLHDFVSFVQFKKHEKQPWRSISFSKVADWSQWNSVEVRDFKGGTFYGRWGFWRRRLVCFLCIFFGYILYFKIIHNRFCQMLNWSWSQTLKGALLQEGLVFVRVKYLIIFFFSVRGLLQVMGRDVYSRFCGTYVWKLNYIQSVIIELIDQIQKKFK